MTDPRLDGRLLAAVRALPTGSGVVFRHYGLPPADRRRLFRQVRHVCAQRGHLLVLADDERTAIAWQADGVHRLQGHRLPSKAMVRTVPVHNIREIRQSVGLGAKAHFLSPVFATRSHPGEGSLGPYQFSRLSRLCGGKVVALGGMTRARAQKWPREIAYGWAAIDAFLWSLPR